MASGAASLCWLAACPRRLFRFGLYGLKGAVEDAQPARPWAVGMDGAQTLVSE